MSESLETLKEKLEGLAEDLNAAKSKLHFLGLVHRVDAPDRWDLLVSSDQLAPWSMEALRYVSERLQKILTPEELVQISRVVALPRNYDLIAKLSRNDQQRAGELQFLHPSESFDRAIVIWPANRTQAPVRR
jgi:hypothetical protein